jgi:pyruvate ferredoxin oxidoreductase alpha subunit
MNSNVKQETMAMNGDEAVAYAVKQSDVDVVAAYPITPQTIIVEKFSEYVADGEVQTEFVCTESEHSAMAASLTASATGARAFTATASAGLALMHEMLFVTSGSRMPVVMAVANRALAQEAYDSIIQAFRIAEHEDVNLPALVGLDGFTLSHTLENVTTLLDDDVKKFVGERKIPVVSPREGSSVPLKLDPSNPVTMGPIALQNYYFEFKRQQEEGMKSALGVIQQVHDEYANLTGRSYGDGLIELYKLDDAEIGVVCAGSTSGTIKTVVDELREEGVKAGLMKIRTFRPFPVVAVQNALSDLKAVGVMDKSMSFGGNGGAMFHEIRHTLYDAKNHPLIVDYIYGLGGRDTNPKEFKKMFNELHQIAHGKRVENLVSYIGLRD